jgi:hypothetical protein
VQRLQAAYVADQVADARMSWAVETSDSILSGFDVE